MSTIPTTHPSTAGGQPIATDISTGKEGLAGSAIAGVVIGGIVVFVLILAICFGLFRRYRRSKGQTASTMEAGPEGENEKEKERCAEVDGSSPGHCLASVAVCPSTDAQDAQSDMTVCQAEPTTSPSNPRKSFDSSIVSPTQIVYSNVTTHAPRPQSYQMCPCMVCTLSRPMASSSAGGTDLSVGSPEEKSRTFDTKSCISSTSPPLPPGAMPPLPSPTLESYEAQFRTSPPPQSPSSPGGSSLRRWIMSPLSRSGTVRTTLPPYEQPDSGLQRRASEKKDESALAASVYTFM